jgi:hypothetical protein
MPKMRPIVFTKDKTVSVNVVESAFYSDSKPIGAVKVERGKATFTPLVTNPERVNLFRASGRFGLAVYYYRDDIAHVFISNGSQFVRINRDEIPALRIALRKFTQNAKPNLKRPVGKPFTEYGPPNPFKSYEK